MLTLTAIHIKIATVLALVLNRVHQRAYQNVVHISLLGLDVATRILKVSWTFKGESRNTLLFLCLKLKITNPLVLDLLNNLIRLCIARLQQMLLLRVKGRTVIRYRRICFFVSWLCVQSNLALGFSKCGATWRIAAFFFQICEAPCLELRTIRRGRHLLILLFNHRLNDLISNRCPCQGSVLRTDRRLLETQKGRCTAHRILWLRRNLQYLLHGLGLPRHLFFRFLLVLKVHNKVPLFEQFFVFQRYILSLRYLNSHLILLFASLVYILKLLSINTVDGLDRRIGLPWWYLKAILLLGFWHLYDHHTLLHLPFLRSLRPRWLTLLLDHAFPMHVHR